MTRHRRQPASAKLNSSPWVTESTTLHTDLTRLRDIEYLHPKKGIKISLKPNRRADHSSIIVMQQRRGNHSRDPARGRI